MKLKAGSGPDTIPAGIYEAALVRVEEAKNAEGSYVKWIFSVSIQGEARSLTGASGMNLDAGSKTRFWTEALLGRPLRADEEIDLEKLVGRPCRIEVMLVEKDGRELPRIAKLTKASGLKLAAKKEPAAPKEDEFGDSPF